MSVYYCGVSTSNKFINKYSIPAFMNTLQKTAAIIGLGALTTIYGCRQTTNTLPSNTIESQYEKKLDKASEILVREKKLCLGKQYNIYVGKEKVATVKGKNWNWWTDKFVLKTVDGKILESESENKKILTYNRSAAFYDGNGNIDGYIAEHTFKDILNLNHLFHVYDAKQTEIGRTEKKFWNVLDKIILYDNKGDTSYIANKKFNWLGKLSRDRYVIKVIPAGNDISKEKMIMLTCIEDAIKDAKKSNHSSSKHSNSE